MATKTYEFRDDQTGQTIRFEGPDDATPEEIADVLDQMAGQLPAQTNAPEVAVPSQQPARTRTPQVGIAAPPHAAEAMSAMSTNPSPTTSMSNNIELRNRPDTESAVQQLFNQGERRPAAFNAMLQTQFPDLTPEERPFINDEMLARAQAFEDYYTARPWLPRPSDMFVFNQPTGLENPEAPTTIAGEVGQGAIRGAADLYNTGVGLAGVAADVVGADDTAVELLDQYVQNSAATDLYYGAGVGTLGDIESLGDAGRYAAGAVGEIVPTLATTAGAGLVGKEVAQAAAARAIRGFVEDRVAAGMTREAAEVLAAQAARRWAQRGLTAGAVSASSAQEIGSIYGDTYAQTNERAPGMAIAAGSVAGLLDAVMPARVASQMATSVRSLITDRLVKEFGTGFITEGSTEALQTFIEQLPTAVITGESPFTEEMGNMMIESFVRGGIGGGAVQGAASVLGGVQRVEPATPSLNGRFGFQETISRPTANPRKATRLYPQQLQQTTQEMADRVNTFTENWENKPNITVHPNFNEVNGVDNDALGVYVDGEVRLNAEALITEADARGVTLDDMVAGVTFHESLGHYALDVQYGEGLDRILENFYHKGPAEFRTNVEKWINDNPDAYKNDPNRTVRATEEVIAEMAEADGRLPVTLSNQIKNYIKAFARRMGLDIGVSDREIRSILAVAQRSVVEGANGSGRKIEFAPRYMYAGTKSNTARMRGFVETADARARGEDVGPDSLVRQETGWFFGPDGMARYEISDHDIRLEEPYYEGIAEREGAPAEDVHYDSSGVLLQDLGNKEFTDKYGSTAYLVDVLGHDELFRAYPSLEDIRVYRHPGRWDRGNRGSYSSDSHSIFVNENLSIGEARSTLLHEVQHAVQQIEGFARGGNTITALNHLPENLLIEGAARVVSGQEIMLRQKRKDLQILRDYINHPLIRNWRRSYLDQKTKYDKYEKSGRVSGSPEQKSWSEAYDATNKAKEDFLAAVGTSTKELLDNPSDFSQYSKIYNSLITHSDPSSDLAYQEKSLNSIQASIDDLKRGVKTKDTKLLRSHLRYNEDATFDAYQHLFGEVEARDTQARESLTPMERRQTTPYTSEEDNIEPDHYIFDMRNSANKYARSRSQAKKTPLSVDELTAEDLVEAQNADEILEGVLGNAKIQSFTNEELIQAATARGVPPSSIISRADIEPGKLTRDMYKYDIAATKLSERLATLYGKISNGTATDQDRMNFYKTQLALDSVASNLFNLDSEAGRMLQAIRQREFTRKKITALRELLHGVQGGEALAALDDPETFAKYARAIMQQMEAKTDKPNTTGNMIVSVLNTPRAIMSSMDLSAPLRQGLYFINTKEFWRSLPGMFKAWNPVKGEAFYQEVMKNIEARPTHALMMQANLSFSSLDGTLNQREESFQSDLAQRIPGVRMSERAYNGFLNKLRADLFDSYLAQMQKAGMDITNKDQLKGLGSWINSGTGRGNLPKGIASAAPMLNALLFSPRLIASRVNLLNPYYYYRLPPVVRRQAIKQSMAFGTLAVMTLSLLAMAIPDAEVEKDPRSSDFGKIQVGNTRYDILGGFSQYIVLGARFAAYMADEHFGIDVGGHRKNSMGELVDYSNEYGADNMGDAFLDFGRNKLSPNAGFAVDFVTNENAIGQPFTFSEAVASRMMPMIFQDFTETMAEEGVVKGAAMAAPAVFGVGVSTYTPAALDTEQPLTVRREFGASGFEDSANEYVSITDENATLTDEGQALWENALNTIFSRMIEERIAQEDWPALSEEDRADAIKEVKNEARDEARSYMLEQMGMK